MKNYIFEGRTEEEVILKSLKELNVKEDEMIYSIKEETYGLLKKKKYIMNVVLKSDVLEYSKNDNNSNGNRCEFRNKKN